MITLQEYLMGRDKDYPLDDEQKAAAPITVQKANELLERAELQRGVRSGYRPIAINSRVPNAAPQSRHITCQAIDIADNDGQLKSFCLRNLEVLEELGLWMEAPEHTPSWLHVQTVPPKSGHRVFIP